MVQVGFGSSAKMQRLADTASKPLHRVFGKALLNQCLFSFDNRLGHTPKPSGSLHIAYIDLLIEGPRQSQ